MNNRVSKQEKERILNETLEKSNPIYQQLFEELKKYHIIYERYTKAMLENSLIIEGKGTAKKLAKKLESIKNKVKLQEILNEQTSVVQKFKENLKENLYKNTELSMNEKSKIIKITQKEYFNEQDKEELFSILSKLPDEELNSLLGKYVPQNNTKSKLATNKEKIRKFLDSILGNNPESINISDVPTLGEIGRKFGGIDSKSISTYLQTQYLPNKFNSEKSSQIYKKFWGSRNPQLGRAQKKVDFNQFMEDLMQKYSEGKNLPNEIGVRALGRRFGVNRMTIPKWIRNYLKNWLGEDESLNLDPKEVEQFIERIYSEIWSSKKPTSNISIEQVIQKIKRKKAEKKIPLSEELSKNENPKPKISKEKEIRKTKRVEASKNISSSEGLSKKDRFELILDSQLKYYPNKIKQIDFFKISQYKLAKSLAIATKTIRRWIKEYIEEKYENKSTEFKEKLYYDLWTSKSAEQKKISYSYIKSFVQNRGGRLITTEKEWNEMKEYPSFRKVKVKCEKGHQWSIFVRILIFDERWCPRCHIRFCQNIMSKYIKKILSFVSNKKIKVKREFSLSKAYGISLKEGGAMKFDIYINNIKISGKDKKGDYKTINVSLAAEYDGIQHDRFPNPIFKDISQYIAQKKRDKRKDEIAIDKQTYIIRIKAKYDYNAKTINKFQEEIIRQIQDWTGLKFDPMSKWIHDRLSNSLKKDINGIKVSVPLDPNAPCKPKLSLGPMDKFLD